MTRFAACGIVFALALGGSLAAQERYLTETIETKDFAVPMTLREALRLLEEKFTAKDQELNLFLDTDAFRETEPDVRVDEMQVQLPPLPRKLTLAQALQRMLAQVPLGAAYLLRDGGIVITTSARAAPAALLRAPVMARFNKKPLEEALQELSAQTGATILLDPRVGDKALAPITAALKNTITLEAAVRLLAEMAELRAIVDNDVLFVTSPPRPAADVGKNVRLEFRGRRLDDALRDIAQATGTTIVVSPEIQQRISAAHEPWHGGPQRRLDVAAAGADELEGPAQSFRVSATFRGDVQAEAAAHLLTMMNGLHAHLVGGALYIAQFPGGIGVNGCNPFGNKLNPLVPGPAQ